MNTCSILRSVFAAAVFLTFAVQAGTGQFDLKVCEEKGAYYFAEHDITKGDSKLKYAVIYIHGAKGGARDAAKNLRVHMMRYSKNEKVYCIAPSFFVAKTVKKSKCKDALLWENGWRGGDAAINGNHISSYEIIDRIYTILSDSKLYPAMKRITLCGFSAGGQFVNRYVAVGKLPAAPHIETVFVVGNPSIYLYINKLRYVDGEFREINADNDFNTWYYGLDKRNGYCKNLSLEEIMKNLSGRKTLYFCGTADTGGMMTREAILQGKNRYDRFLIYKKYTSLFSEWAKAIRFFAVPGIKHSSEVFYKNDTVPQWILGKEPIQTADEIR